MNVRWGHIRKKKPIDDTAEWGKPLIEHYKKKLAGEQENTREPHMLHVVYRVKPLSGRPWWEKRIMTQLGLDGKVITYL